MNNTFSKLDSNKQVYFASDFHLGAPNLEKSHKREKKIIRWIDEIAPSAAGIVLVGDIFDFWFEYKRAVPKGAVRLLGKLAEMSDKGLPIVVFTGNHDLWMRDYLTQELNVVVYHQPEVFQIGKQKIYVGHGDGLGPGDRKFKFIKRIFTAGANQALFRWLHPDIGIKLAEAWSAKSRQKDLTHPQPFLGENEPLFRFCQQIEAQEHHDGYVFGHRHYPHQLAVSDRATYYNLGDWVEHFTYGIASINSFDLKKYED